MAPTQNNCIAMVYCTGGSRAKRREGGDLSYLDCRMAKQAYADGVLECAQGCLGLGSCVEACRLDAIHIGPHGAAVVDRNACVGCGLCVEACPQNLIRLVDADTVITPAAPIRTPALWPGTPATSAVSPAGSVRKTVRRMPSPWRITMRSSTRSGASPAECAR